ncbi:MAG: hypothetical protein COT15_02225 [Candidatus Diapherotrites archaeon CG08_land_8_20_14_0_20_34_12]|nr:MAG: hypothetical protein COT15_02225 [Candidatus Diapherotrites archaeon CG08_land_8_20_14_0_20_34_12]
MAEQGVMFVANMGNWQSVKKLTIEEKTDPRTIMEFLASLNTGLDNKVEDNLRKIVKLELVDAFVKEELAGKGKSENEIASVLAVLKGPKLGKVLNEICELPELQKGERDEVKDFCRVYALRKALKQLGVMLDYSQIEIPGMKRVMKKANKA